MKILVTGGAGFIGSAVIRHIINNTQDSVINLDKLTYAGNLESLVEVSNSDRYVFEQVDICDADELKRVFSEHQPDAVMHLAAESHVDRSIDGPAEFIQTNIVGTYVLLEAARAYWNTLPEARKQAFRFHHISTDEVYGDLPHPNDSAEDASAPVGAGHACDNGLPLFTEETSYAPSSPYSASKASSDHLVRAWLRTYGFPTLITNCSNNYGPFHFPEKLIPLVILNALEGKPLPIYGKGDQIRDWLYVEDHARALYKVVTEGIVGETYNIGGHNEKQNIEVVETICEILDELHPRETATSQAPRSDEGVITSAPTVIANETPVIANEVKQSMDCHVAPLLAETECVIASTAKQSTASSYKSLITYVTDRPGHDRRYAIDASKIANELNWHPEETFESGIRKTVQWYLDSQQWCKNVQDGSYQRERLGATV